MMTSGCHALSALCHEAGSYRGIRSIRTKVFECPRSSLLPLILLASLFSARLVLVIIASFSRCYFHTLAPSVVVVPQHHLGLYQQYDREKSSSHPTSNVFPPSPSGRQSTGLPGPNFNSGGPSKERQAGSGIRPYGGISVRSNGRAQL